MKSTDVLKREHKLVLAVVSGAEREAQQIRRNSAVDVERIRKFVDFFRNFVDKCHHSKEEKLLFPKLEERGIPNEGGPVGMMLLEHTQGRAHVAAIASLIEKAEDGDRKAADAIAGELQAYGTLLRAHIDKENECLFAMADSALSADDQEELCRAFEAFESAEMGEGVHDLYHQLAHELAENRGPSCSDSV